MIKQWTKRFIKANSIEPFVLFRRDDETPPSNLSAPIVSGIPATGNTLSCTTGAWTADPSPTFAYQWQADSGSGYVDISGEILSTLDLDSGLLGATIRCIVTATNIAGSSSANSNEIIEIGEIPNISISPVVSGTTVQNSTLSCTTGTWNGTATISYTYAWIRDNGVSAVYIPGATMSTYTLTVTDISMYIYCNVTATNSYGNATQISNGVGPIDAYTEAPINTVAPVLSGTPTEDQTLSCTTGTWTGIPSPTYSYQWRRSFGTGYANIGGATSSTYLLVTADVGETIRCVVTATNVAGAASANSNTSATIAPSATSPVNTVAPVATGTVKIGSTLSVTNGTWTGTPSPTYTYQWKRNGVSIGGATSSTYSVVALDMDKSIKATVTATNVAAAVSADSNNLASPWKDILVAKSGVLIWDGTDTQCYNGVTSGGSVVNLYSVDGTLIGTQSISGSRGSRSSNRLVLDGIDDHYILDAHASKLNSASLFITGFDDPNDVSTSARTMFSTGQTTSGGSTEQIRYNYSRPGAVNATRMGILVADTAGTSALPLTSLGAVGAGPYDNVLRFTASPGSQYRVDRLLSPLVQVDSTQSRPVAVPPSYDWFTIGARRVGAVPTVSQYWDGKFRHFAIHNTAWSDADLALYRTCAINAGVMS